MTDLTELERLRLTDADLERSQEIEKGLDFASGVVCLVISDGSFPGVAGRYYKVQPVIVTGDESEGSTGTFTDTTGSFYALNLGATVPTVNVTRVLVVSTDYRYVFEY